MVRKYNSIILATLVCFMAAAVFVGGSEGVYAGEKHYEATSKPIILAPGAYGDLYALAASLQECGRIQGRKV